MTTPTPTSATTMRPARNDITILRPVRTGGTVNRVPRGDNPNLRREKFSQLPGPHVPDTPVLPVDVGSQHCTLASRPRRRPRRRSQSARVRAGAAEADPVAELAGHHR